MVSLEFINFNLIQFGLQSYLIKCSSLDVYNYFLVEFYGYIFQMLIDFCVYGRNLNFQFFFICIDGGNKVQVCSRVGDVFDDDEVGCMRVL